MKLTKLILMIMFSQIILFHTPTPLAAQQLEEVVKNYITSTWGDTDLESIKSIRISGYAINESGGPAYYFTQVLKVPNMIKIEYSTAPKGKGYTTAYDGETGWELNGGDDTAVAAKLSDERSRELYSSSWIVEPFIQAEKIGAEVELAGMKLIKGYESFELIVTLEGGVKKVYFIDSIKYRLIGSADITVENSENRYSGFTYHKDYKVVNGINFSFLSEQKLANGKTIGFKTLRVEVNPKISDSYFKMP